MLPPGPKGLREDISNTLRESDKIWGKSRFFSVFVFLKWSHNFLSMIFGFLSKFRVDIEKIPIKKIDNKKVFEKQLDIPIKFVCTNY